MSLQYRTKESPHGDSGIWGKWKDYTGAFTIYPTPVAIDVQIREKPPFEPGFYQDVSDEQCVKWFDYPPPMMFGWRKVTVTPKDED